MMLRFGVRVSLPDSQQTPCAHISYTGRVQQALRYHRSHRTSEDEDEDVDMEETSSDESLFFANSSRNMYHNPLQSRHHGFNGNESDEEIHVSEDDEEDDEDDDNRPSTHKRHHVLSKQKVPVHGHGTRAAMAAHPAATAAPRRSFFTGGFFPPSAPLIRPQLWDGKPVVEFPYRPPGVVV